jgi:Zn-dependent M28 family amino/carboxypeptidase
LRRFFVPVVALLAGCVTPPQPSAMAPIAEAELRALMAPLASDSFEGRMSGTKGEERTVAYLAERFRAAGVAGAMPGGGYEQRFAIPAQRRAIAGEDSGEPHSGQWGFTRAVNAAGGTSSRNMIGVVRGRRSDGKAVVVMAHWDHLGICRDSGEDRICNGAVDNASGVAAVLALAARVAGLKLDRDVWFVLTGAEEWGLLGAEAFADSPPVALQSIVAAFNLDTIAVAPAGMPVALVGAPDHGLEPLVRESAAAMGRAFDGDDQADGFLMRHDGWALARRGVPAVMAGGSFSDVKRLQAFLASTYHSVDDELTDTADLSGAADDANLHVELVRRAASRRFRPGR